MKPESDESIFVRHGHVHDKRKNLQSLVRPLKKIEDMKTNHYNFDENKSDIKESLLIIDDLKIQIDTLEVNGELATAVMYDWAKNPVLRAKKAAKLEKVHVYHDKVLKAK